MQIEIRADGMHIEGYVNVPGRMSRPIANETRGTFLEEIEQRAFQRAIDRAKEIRMLVDHEESRRIASTADNTLELYEDEVGLRAISTITDATVIQKAKEGKLRGWSFDMRNIADEMEQRAEGYPIRHIKDFDMSEISLIIDKIPCYNSTTVEVRAGEEVTIETRASDSKIYVTDKRAKEVDYSEYESIIDELKSRKGEQR